MLIALALPEDVYLALGRLAEEQELRRDEAAVAVLREWLLAHEYLEVEEVDDGKATEGD